MYWRPDKWSNPIAVGFDPYSSGQNWAFELGAGSRTMKLLCMVIGHRWTEWRIHPTQGLRDIRHCKRCGEIQERK